MRRIKIAEIKNMEDGEIVPSIVGKFLKVYPRKSGEHPQHGPWSFQDVFMRDGDGEDDIITIKVENHEDLSGFAGKEMEVSCWKSDKHGLVGLKAFDDEYNGNVRRKVKASKTATIQPLEAGESSGAGEPTQQSSNAPKVSPAPTQSRTGAPSELTEMQVKKNLNQLANFDLQCGVAADYARHKMKERGIEMTAEEFQARWSSYFITGTREGWHRAFPTGEYEWPDKKVKAAPEQSHEPEEGNPF